MTLFEGAWCLIIIDDTGPTPPVIADPPGARSGSTCTKGRRS